VKQNYNGPLRNDFQAQGSMAAGFPAPALLAIPGERHRPIAGHVAAERDARRDPDGAATRRRCIVERRRIQRSCRSCCGRHRYVGNRGVDLVMDVDRTPSLVYNSGNAGRRSSRSSTAPATRASGRTRQVQVPRLQMKDRSRLQRGLMITNSYTLAVDGLRERERRRSARRSTFRRAGGRRTSIAPTTTRSTTIYDLPSDRSASWLQAGSRARSSAAGRSARCLSAQSGTPLHITAKRPRSNTPGNTRFADLVGTRHISAASARADSLLRPGGLRAAAAARRAT
jgi:hypothetical protein